MRAFHPRGVCAAEDGDLAPSIAVGACGVISKHASPEALVQSLRVVADGGHLLPGPAPDLLPPSKEDGIDGVLAVLTEREREIMCLVSEGLSNKGIARRLSLSQGTIKVHLHHVYQKLEIKQTNGTCGARDVAAVSRPERDARSP